MQSTRLHYRIDRRQISMVRFIFEAYEGIAVVTTLDASAGIIVLSVAPGCEKMVQRIMNDMARDFIVEPLPRTAASERIFKSRNLGPNCGSDARTSGTSFGEV